MTRWERAFVWIGGVIFVTALAVCAGWYLFVLGHAAPPAGWRAVAFDTALFSIFALHHSVFAREPVKRKLAAIPPHLRRSVYVWIASLLLMIVCLAWQTIGGDLYDAAGARGLAHAVVQLTGVWLIGWSVARIDPLELAGIRASTGISSLQIEGPYRLVRHPLYLGWIVAVFGTGHLTGDRLAFAAISSIYLLVAVTWEEQSLMQSFGEDYARYAQQVRWRVIPFVY
jgi:protein-S-isoprenylcysteine O-methyltransferase Ste14